MRATYTPGFSSLISHDLDNAGHEAFLYVTISAFPFPSSFWGVNDLLNMPIPPPPPSFGTPAAVSARTGCEISYSYLCELSVSGGAAGILPLKQRNK